MKLFRDPRESMTKGTWINGKKKITGHWTYIWGSDRFVILLDSKDRITGNDRKIVTSNDIPEWGNWKLQRKTDNYMANRDPRYSKLIEEAFMATMADHPAGPALEDAVTYIEELLEAIDRLKQLTNIKNEYEE